MQSQDKQLFVATEEEMKLEVGQEANLPQYLKTSQPLINNQQQVLSQVTNSFERPSAVFDPTKPMLLNYENQMLSQKEIFSNGGGPFNWKQSANVVN